MEITERQIEVDGRTFTERVEVSYRQSDNGELVKTTTVHRTIAVGEKERRVIRFVHYFFCLLLLWRRNIYKSGNEIV